MTAESDLLHLAEDQIVQHLEEAQHDARVADAPSERTPLVLKADKGVEIDVEVAPTQSDEGMTTRDLAIEEAKGLTSLAIPFTGAQAVEVVPSILFSILLSSVAGDQSAKVLAASSLSDFFETLVIASLTGGLGSALETVCAQSYGAKQYAQLCLYAQAGLLGLAYCAPVVVLLCLNSANVFKLIGQDPALAEIAQVFTTFSAVSFPFSIITVVSAGVLMSQHIAAPFTVIPIVANVIALPLAYALGTYTRLGYVGVLIGMAVAGMIKCAIVVPLVFTSPACSAGAWPGFQWREAHALLQRLVPLAISSLLMVTFQTLGLNIVPMLCGYLPNAEQAMASNNIAISLFSMAIVPPVGAFASGCIRVGTALGGGKARRASIAGNVGTVLTMAVAIVSTLVSLYVNRSFASGYTQDEAIAEAATTLYYRIAVIIPLFGWLLGVQGVLRACGKQWLIANLSFLFLFVIGVPTGLFLAITCELGTQGLWYGQMIGLVGCGIVTTWYVCRLDWDEVSREAYRNTHVHANDSKEPTPEPPRGPTPEPSVTDEDALRYTQRSMRRSLPSVEERKLKLPF